MPVMVDECCREHHDIIDVNEDNSPSDTDEDDTHQPLKVK